MDTFNKTYPAPPNNEEKLINAILNQELSSI